MRVVREKAKTKTGRKMKTLAALTAVIIILAVAAALSGCAKNDNLKTPAPANSATAALPSAEATLQTTDEPGATADTGTQTADTATDGPTTGAPDESTAGPATPPTTAPASTAPSSEPATSSTTATAAPSTGNTGTSAPTEGTSAPTAAPATPSDGKMRTEEGYKYTASGFTSQNADRFSFTKGLTLTFDSGTLAGDFNRLTVKYTSTKPLQIFVKYLQNGKEKNDDFYLEAGENATFSGLVSSYLSGGKGRELRSVSVDSLSGKAEFALTSVKAETVQVHNDKLYFLENDRFKVGIQLSWGGGINYIEDKTCTVEGLKNLVNRHDTGRLIQQSYYGTAGNSQYTPGEFNGSKWVYNPVQGGDKYGNSSRLIDVVVGADSVYIKSQPQDWSLNGQITKSYMENTYTLTGGYVRVDNRFVDFSGWQHRYAHQELPAFYTVSYLDRFTWYDGNKSWTGDKLSSRSNLQFWGDARYADSCRFFMQRSNTETWCAWVSSKDDFGLGLYVPNIDMLYAGRFSYNGSKSDMDGATNYVAPLLTIKLVSFNPIEYSYLITAGSTASIRETFTANKDFASNASLHRNYQTMRVADKKAETVDAGNIPETIDFSVRSNVGLITQTNNSDVDYDSGKKAMRVTVLKAHDPHLTIDYSFADEPLYAEDYSAIEIEYMIPDGNKSGSYECDLFLCTGGKTSPDGSERTRVTLNRTGQFGKIRVELSELPFWQGIVNSIRFDYFDSCAEGDVIFIKSFNLVK